MLFYLIDTFGATPNSFLWVILQQLCEYIKCLGTEQVLVLCDQIIFLVKYVLNLSRDFFRLYTLLLVVLIWV